VATDVRPLIRLDKWLWQARFFKTRTLAAKTVAAGHVRVNGVKTAKPARAVGTGDTLTFAQGRVIRVVRIVALGDRRGPAPEARMLYDDLTPARDNIPPAPRYEGKGRPSRKQRRQADLFKERPLD